jgi:hypothetical protein
MDGNEAASPSVAADRGACRMDFVEALLLSIFCPGGKDQILIDTRIYTLNRSRTRFFLTTWPPI